MRFTMICLRGDVGESIEIAGSSGKDLTGWSWYYTMVCKWCSLQYYSTSGTLANVFKCFGFLHAYPSNGIQNIDAQMGWHWWIIGAGGSVFKLRRSFHRSRWCADDVEYGYRSFRKTHLAYRLYHCN